MKNLVLILLFPISIFGQNGYKMIDEHTRVFIEIDGQRHYLSNNYTKVIKTVDIPCFDYNCVIKKAQRLVKENQFVKAMEQLNCARYYTNPPSKLIDSLSVDIVKRLSVK